MPIDKVNATLGTNLKAGHARVSSQTHRKLMEKHGGDYAAIMDNIKLCLREPDFIGTHPAHPGKISMVKRISGLPNGKPAMVLAVVISSGGNNYPVASAYGLRESQFNKWIASGSLKKAKTRSTRVSVA